MTAYTSRPRDAGVPDPKELAQIDCAVETAHATTLISKQIKDAGASSVVLGLSGGLDSAVCAALCARTCDTLAMIMPDYTVTPASEVSDARRIADALGIHTQTVDIGPIVSEFTKSLSHTAASLGNVRARVRMIALYNHANATSSLVVGTSDKSETLIGYFTKHGDGACDIAPIAKLYKVQVREMAEYLGIPRDIVLKKSAPYIADMRTAEDEIGMDYDELDPILCCIIDRNMDDAKTAALTSTSVKKVARVRRLCELARHKQAAGEKSP